VDDGLAPGRTGIEGCTHRLFSRRLFSRRTSTQLVPQQSRGTMRSFANFCLTSRRITSPRDAALVAAHTNGEGRGLIPTSSRRGESSSPVRRVTERTGGTCSHSPRR